MIPSSLLGRCGRPIVLFFCLLLSGLTLPALAQSGPVDVIGETSVIVFDDFQLGRSEIRYYIVEEKTGRERRLHFGGEPPGLLKSGQLIRVRGRGRPDDGIDVETLAELNGEGSTADDGSAAALAPPETRRVLTLLVDFNDAVVSAGSNGTDVPSVRDRMYNETRNVAGLLFNASLGTLTLDPDADGDGRQDVFHVSIDDSYIGGDPSQCSPSTWVQLASTAWQQANPGKDIGIYRHRLLITPNYWDYGNRHCTWGGIAQLGCGTWCWAIGADPESIMHGVIVHELGHNLGFNHARLDGNNNGFISGEASDSEYGDDSDMMGLSRNWKKFNPPHAEDLGWIDPVDYEIREVIPDTSAQIFDLLPLDDEAWDWPGLRALRTARSSNSDYYVAFRRASGDYNTLDSEYRDRLAIYYGTDNSTYSYFVTSLAAGQSFADTAQDLVITATGTVPVSLNGNSTVAMTVEICRQNCSATPAPSGLTATPQSTSTIDLDWVDNTADEDGFDIQRSPDGSSWTLVGTVPADTTGYLDTGLASGTDYWYRVRASSPVEDSGWSNVASAKTFGIPPQAAFSFADDFLQVVFTDESTDSDGTVVGWMWSFGDGGTSTSRNPTHVYAQAGIYDVSLTVTDEDGYTGQHVQAVTVSAPPYTDHSPVSDTPVDGSVSGSYTATATDDGAFQAITEHESGGRKQTRYSYLEHRWTFDIPAGDSATVMVNAWRTPSSDGDTFDFEWSANSTSWSPMFNLSATTDGTPLPFDLPAGVSGTVHLRAFDTNRSAGNNVLDTLYVDLLKIRVFNGAPQPLEGDAPSGLVASTVSHSSIALTWDDNTSNEAGFSIERSIEGGSFVEVAATAPNAGGLAAYTDTGLDAETTYTYRVRAFKGAEVTTWSGTAQATTGPAPAMTLQATGYKVKGVQNADLTWSGAATTQVLIRRDGTDIATTNNDGAYTDAIGAKGSGSYAYQVCETDGGACSGLVTVTF